MDCGKVKAVLFDLDGTLLDTIYDIGASANIALRRYGFPERPIDSYRALVGNGIRVFFHRALPEGVDEAVFEQVLACYLATYPERCTVDTRLFPGVLEMVQALSGRYALGVYSNKTERTARKVIAHYFPETPFRLVWGNDGTRPLKPDPAAGTLLCRELGLEPEEILFFGDGDTDMVFGRNAGFHTVACSWGYRDRGRLEAAGAQRIVDRPEELTELLAAAQPRPG